MAQVELFEMSTQPLLPDSEATQHDDNITDPAMRDPNVDTESPARISADESGKPVRPNAKTHQPNISHQVSTSQTHRLDRAVDLWRSGWTVEISSCIIAVISLLGMVLTLWKHQDKPLPDWPQPVSINAIVSLFSMTLRGTLGVVVAEGPSLQPIDMQFEQSFVTHPRNQSVKVAMVSTSSAVGRLTVSRRCQSWYDGVFPVVA